MVELAREKRKSLQKRKKKKGGGGGAGVSSKWGVTRILKQVFAWGYHFMPSGLEPGYQWPHMQGRGQKALGIKKGRRSDQKHKGRNSEGQQGQWHVWGTAGVSVAETEWAKSTVVKEEMRALTGSVSSVGHLLQLRRKGSHLSALSRGVILPDLVLTRPLKSMCWK